MLYKINQCDKQIDQCNAKYVMLYKTNQCYGQINWCDGPINQCYA